MPKKTKPAKQAPMRQVNVRWGKDIVDALDVIAHEEQNDRSEVVRFLVEWALPLRNIFGSFEMMRSVPRETYGSFIIETVEEFHIKKGLERRRKAQEFLEQDSPAHSQLEKETHA